MEATTIWSQENIVRTYDVDFQGCWKPSSLIETVLEAGTQHANSMGFDFEDMQARDQVWVLSRLKLRFGKLPKLGEKVLVQTWIKGIQQKIFFLRDFEVLTLEGQRLAGGRFAMLLINPTLRKILPASALGVEMPSQPQRAALDETLEKLDVPDGLPEKRRITVGYSMVDVLGHANTARYVDWVCDCFDAEDYRSKLLDSLQINFINEARMGEVLSIRAAQKATDWRISGENLSSGQRTFEAAVGWREGNNENMIVPKFIERG
jgi:acyl-CoA thioesterase FadM